MPGYYDFCVNHPDNLLIASSLTIVLFILWWAIILGFVDCCYQPPYKLYEKMVNDLNENQECQEYQENHEYQIIRQRKLKLLTVHEFRSLSINYFAFSYVCISLVNYLIRYFWEGGYIHYYILVTCLFILKIGTTFIAAKHTPFEEIREIREIREIL